MTAESATLAMPGLLGQVGRECGELAGELERLQDTLAVLLNAVEMTPELLERVQALDRVFQHIGQLGGVASRVADLSSPAWRVDAQEVLAQVSLSALVHRLSGGEHEAAANDEFDWF